MSGKPQSVEDHKRFSRSRCDSVLRTALGQSTVTWWETQNEDLGDRTPSDVWDDDYAVVYRYVMSRYARR